MSIDLGRLEPVALRDVWANEALHFTPWLASEPNIALLGETIGIDLEVEAIEKDVGPFRADILCRDTLDGSMVLIENQLGPTDHGHLGQTMTYAAGLDAVTIIWITAKVRDEHRATIEWLNQITDEDFRFFGLEVELWRIGDSLAAPKFNVVAKPNDWSKTVSAGKQRMRSDELSPTQELQLAYWTAFREHVEAQDSTLRSTKPLPQTWMAMAIGRTGFRLQAVASTYDGLIAAYSGNEVRAELSIDAPQAKGFFAALCARESEIEAAFGEPLEWVDEKGVKSCKVVVRKSVDLSDRQDWPAQHEWLRMKLEKLDAVFRPIVRELEPALAEPSGP